MKTWLVTTYQYGALKIAAPSLAEAKRAALKTFPAGAVIISVVERG